MSHTHEHSHTRLYSCRRGARKQTEKISTSTHKHTHIRTHTHIDRRANSEVVTYVHSHTHASTHLLSLSETRLIFLKRGGRPVCVCLCVYMDYCRLPPPILSPTLLLGDPFSLPVCSWLSGAAAMTPDPDDCEAFLFKCALSLFFFFFFQVHADGRCSPHYHHHHHPHQPPCCALKHPAAQHPGEVSVKRAESGKSSDGGGVGGGGGRCQGVSGTTRWPSLSGVTLHHPPTLLPRSSCAGSASFTGAAGGGGG